MGVRPSQATSRKFRLVQTDAGREALQRAQETLSTVFIERLRRLDREDVLAFDRIVKRLAERNGVSQGS